MTQASHSTCALTESLLIDAYWWCLWILPYTASNSNVLRPSCLRFDSHCAHAHKLQRNMCMSIFLSVICVPINHKRRACAPIVRCLYMTCRWRWRIFVVVFHRCSVCTSMFISGVLWLGCLCVLCFRNCSRSHRTHKWTRRIQSEMYPISLVDNAPTNKQTDKPQFRNIVCRVSELSLWGRTATVISLL